jgi:hypothetical protein
MKIAVTMALKSATLFSDRDGAEHAKPYGAFSASVSSLCACAFSCRNSKNVSFPKGFVP